MVLLWPNLPRIEDDCYYASMSVQATLNLIKSTVYEEASLKVLYSSLLFLSKIFYSLNFQVCVPVCYKEKLVEKYSKTTL